MSLRSFSCVFFALLTSAALAQVPAVPPPLISTSGSAVIRVVPDLVDLKFEVEVRGGDLAQARQEQSARAIKVLEALRAAGVPEKGLQMSLVEIKPNYNDQRGETEKVWFYGVSQSVSCTLSDLKKVPDLIGAVVAAGATSVAEANFRTTDLLKHRAAARTQAILAAKEKAIALATELGVKVGKPYTIIEDNAPEWIGFGGVTSNRISHAVSPVGEISSTFAPGTISVSETIKVSFLLE